MRISCLGLLVCMVLSAGVNAQAPVDYQGQYLRAKTLFNKGQFALAQEAFQEIMILGDQTGFEEYSSYYYAMAAYEQGFVPLARDMFLQIAEKHKNWSSLHEVHIWISRIYFEELNPSRAIHFFNIVTRPRAQNEIVDMKTHFISKMTDVDSLKSLWLEYPNDSEIGSRLALMLNETTMERGDVELLTDLVDLFQLPEKKYTVLPDEPVFKDSYKVAMMLPFGAKTLELRGSQADKNLATNLYDGFRLGLSNLGDSCNYELFVYDTDRQVRATQRILEQEELKSMDLIIGPLYPRPSRVVSEFCLTNKINMLNPVSSNEAVMGSNPFSLLLHPSHSTIGKKIGEYATATFSNKNAVVYYGTNVGDSAMAFSYKQTLLADSFNIVIMKEINREGADSIYSYLTDTHLIKYEVARQLNNDSLNIFKTRVNGDLELLKIAPDSIGHVFVASSDELIVAEVGSAVTTRGDSTAVLGLGSWLNFKYADYGSMEKLNFQFAHQDYDMDLNSQYFTSKFVSEYGTKPDRFAWYGYKTALLLQKAFTASGKYFQKNYQDDKWFNYSGSNDNNVVPIVRIVDHRLVQVIPSEGIK